MNKVVCLSIVLLLFALTAGCASTSSIAPPKPAPLPQISDTTDVENKPLTVLPADPPLPPGSEEMSDDSWGKDDKKSKLKEKDKKAIKNSPVDDDSWGGD